MPFAKDLPPASALRSATGEPAREYHDLSKTVPELDAFISHSWKDTRTAKFFSLALHFRAWDSVMWASLLLLVVFPLQHRLAAMGMLGNGIDMDGGGMRMCGMCHLSWGIAFILMVIFGSPTPWMPRYCFLDRLCIHQTDPQLKKRGIDSLGGFLARSKRMVVIYSSSYISRLWCTFELAAKVRTHGVESIDLMPTAVCGAVGGPCVLCILASAALATGGLLGYETMDSLMMNPPMLIVLVCVIVGNVVIPLRMSASLQAALEKTEAELDSMQVNKLECFDEKDRSFVEGCIHRWYGSSSAFEQTIRNGLVPTLRARGILRQVCVRVRVRRAARALCCH